MNGEYERLLYDLREVLSRLYEDVSSAKRVAQDVRLPTIFIDFSGDAASFWGEIVKEAERRGAIRDLISFATHEYSEGPYADELARIRQGLAWYRTREPVNPFRPGGQEQTDSERLIKLEVQVSLLMWAVGGLYVGLFILGLLILLRT